jgi:predicted RecB family nuclease
MLLRVIIYIIRLISTNGWEDHWPKNQIMQNSDHPECREEYSKHYDLSLLQGLKDR